MKPMRMPRYLLYLMLAGFVIGAIQIACVLALQMMPGWHVGLPGWFVAFTYLLDLPGAVGEMGASKSYPPDTVTVTYIAVTALYIGAFNALFYGAFGTIARYSYVKFRRRWGGARRAA